jgi:class 3 adenylate cyclase/tetratricopeptide (TPR) repeat protein
MFKCASCGHKNKINAKFCPECGFKLSGAAVPHSPLQDELKLLTMLFADISGFTAMSGKLAPDEVKEIIDELFEKLTGAIESERGKVIKYEGDCIMAAFGTGESGELDPVHCCYAALKMRRELADFSASLQKTRGFELNMRIGLHSGRAVVGLIGGRLDIMGDAVNIAARMEQNAGIGKIMLTSDMAGQLKGRFLLERLGPLKVKGREEPVQTYNLTGRARIGSRTILDRQTEMVGRENELGSMVEKFEESESDSAPRLFFIEGPAGCGKSRLVQEFEQRCGVFPVPVKVIKSFFNSTIASDYHVFKVFFKTLGCGCGNESELLLHLERAMKDFPRKRLKDYSKIISYLLGFEYAEDEYVKRMKQSPKEFIPIIFKAFEDYFAAAASEAPHVFIIEDLHWADEGSVKLMAHLLRWTCGKLFFIATSRKSPKDSNFDFPEHKTALCRLNYLSGEQSRVMSEKLLNVNGAAAAEEIEPVISKICSVADGNPLFIEELVISMYDLGIIFEKNNIWVFDKEKFEKLSLPSTVEMAIQARIEGLSAGNIDLLKKASVIGRKFSEELLLYLTGQKYSKKSTPDFDELIKKGILLRAGPESCIFSHDTIRDVVYGKLTKRQKIALHEKIALWLEKSMAAGEFGENMESLICFHFEKALNKEKTVHYALLAAKASYEKYRVEDAINHYDLILKYLNDDNRLLDEGRLIEYLEGSSDAMILAGRIAGLLDILKKYGEGLFSAENLVRLNLKKIQAHRIFSDDMTGWEKLLDETESILNDAESVKLIKASGEQRYLSLLAGLYESRGVFYISFRGIGDKTLFYLEEALKIRMKTGNETRAASCLTNIGFYHSIKGNHKTAVGFFKRALKAAKKTRDKRVTAICMINLGVISQTECDYESAAKYYKKAFEISAEIGDRRDLAVSLINIGNIHSLKGEYDQGLKCCQKALAIAREIGHKRGISDWMVEIGEIYVKKGDHADAGDYFKRAQLIADEIGYKYCKANCLKGFGNISIREADCEKALDYYEQALKLYEEAGSGAEANNMKITIGECLKNKSK